MLPRITSQSIKRLVSFKSSSTGVKSPSSLLYAAFSTAEIVPGIGFGKTSTGLVSLESSYLSLLLFPKILRCFGKSLRLLFNSNSCSYLLSLSKLIVRSDSQRTQMPYPRLLHRIKLYLTVWPLVIYRKRHSIESI